MLVFYLLSRLHLSRLLTLVGPSYQALQVPKEIVTPGFVRAAHELDLRVDAWTVNNERNMRRMLGYGVDGIMTDHPDVLSRVLEKGTDN